MNGQAKVLVVDDEPQILTSIQGLLEDGFTVLTSTDAEEGLRLLGREDVAVILSDQRMPGLSGDQFLSRAREISQATRVLITGYADLNALVQAVNMGNIYAYIAKPWDPVELRVTLQKAAEHYRLVLENQRLNSELLHMCKDLQKAYDDLRHTQQAIIQQERLKALGQMASGIAHDVNNALSPILGYAQLLLIDEEKLNEDQVQYLRIIRQSATDITHTIGRMREFYRPQDIQEMPLPVSLNQMAQQALDLTRPRWKDMSQERGIVIEVEIDLQDGLPLIPGVESEIREALTNLIFNAVDAMPQGGRIKIKTGIGGQGSGGPHPPPDPLPLPREREGVLRALSTPLGEGEVWPSTPAPRPPAVVLEVTDTGVGMDEETRQRCLEPFYSTKGEEGTGLGLAMVFGTMQRHEGDIDIESEVGKGTTVRLAFPVRKANAGSVLHPETVARYTGPSLRVLCVDDDPLVLDLMRRVLEKDGTGWKSRTAGRQG